MPKEYYINTQCEEEKNFPKNDLRFRKRSLFHGLPTDHCEIFVALSLLHFGRCICAFSPSKYLAQRILRSEFERGLRAVYKKYRFFHLLSVFS